MENNNEKKFNKITEIIKIAISVITLIFVGIIGTIFTNFLKSKEINQKYVELSISILKTKPKDDESLSIRKWAIDILNEYSDIKLSDSAKEELLKKSIYKNYYTCPDGINVYEYSQAECPECDSLKAK